MFGAMARAGVASRPDAVDDESWFPAAHEAIAAGITRGTLGAFVVDAVPKHLNGCGHSLLLACAIGTLEQRVPGPGFPRGISGTMSSVFVEPVQRGRGLARAVVTVALSWLQEKNAEVVDLHATPDAERLYRSLGFSEPRSVSLRRVSLR